LRGTTVAARRQELFANFSGWGRQLANGKTHQVPLRGTLGLRDAPELAATLRAAIDSHASVTLDASELAEADISILQVLVAAHKSAEAAGKALRLGAPADGPFALLLERAGFVGADGTPRTDAERFWTDHGKGRAA
jgi:anti-anti-sigma regulatory factor